MIIRAKPNTHKISGLKHSKEIAKNKNKKSNLEIIEEASTRFAEILMKQIELNKQHSTK